MMQTVTMPRLFDHLPKKIPQNQQTTFRNNRSANNHINDINLETLCSPTPAIVS